MSDIGVMKSPYPAPSLQLKLNWITDGMPLTWTDCFLLVTILLAISGLVVSISESTKGPAFDKLGFIIFGFVYVAFAGFRPLGTAADDHGYLIKFERLCSLFDCGNTLFRRDFVWYGLVSALKAIYPRPEVMLWLSGIGLVLKLWVIFALTRYRMLALLAYVSVFYLVDDITALRASLAGSFFLLGIMVAANKNAWQALPLMILSGLTHVQGFVSLLVLSGNSIIARVNWLIGLMVVPIVLAIIGLHPGDGFVRGMLDLPVGRWIVNPLGENPYVIRRTLELKSDGVRSVPVVMPPLMMCLAYVMYSLRSAFTKSVLYAGTSVAFASVALWYLAYSPSTQFRISNFLLVPMVVLIGCAPNTKLFSVLVIAVCALFLAKYNIVHTMLFDGSRIHVAASENGYITKAYTQVCDFHCTYDMDTATLDALPDPGFIFSGWSGECIGQDNPCRLSVYKNANVSALFAPAVTLNVGKMGNGDLVSTPPAIHCGKICSGTLPKDSSVRLSAQPANGWYFKQWGGACSGSDPVCVMSMSSDTGVSAKFVRRFWVKISLSGRGTIKRDGVNVNCKEHCEIQELGDTDLTITAQPESGYRFEGWSGACSHKKYACTFMLTGNTSLSARFVAEEPLPPISPQGEVLHP